MSGMFRPVDDFCIDCKRLISYKTERNYIVWDMDNSNEDVQVYKRQCADCHDAEKLRRGED